MVMESEGLQKARAFKKQGIMVHNGNAASLYIHDENAKILKILKFWHRLLHLIPFLLCFKEQNVKKLKIWQKSQQNR